MKLFALVAASAAVICAQSPITKLPPDTVVATSDGKPITAGEIRNVLESGDPKAIGMARNNPEQFVANLFVFRYLAAEAEKQHLADQSPLKEQLEYVRNTLLAGAIVNQMRDSYNVPEQAINEFYERNKSRYEMARIKVIVIGFCPTVPKNSGTSDEAIAEAAKAAVAAAACKNKHTEEQ